MLAVPWAWLALFLLAPCAIVLAIALSEPVDAVPPFSLAHPGLDSLVQVATDPLYRTALLLSLKVAGLSTFVCLLVGYPMALAIARAREGQRALLLLLVMLPFWTGFLMRINAWIGLLQDDGWINAALGLFGLAPLRLLYTDTAMYVGIVYTYLPFMVLPSLCPALADRSGAAGGGGRSRRPALARLPARDLAALAAGRVGGGSAGVRSGGGRGAHPESLGGPQAQLIGRVLWGEFFQNRDWPTAAAVAVALLVVLLAAPAAVLGPPPARPFVGRDPGDPLAEKRIEPP